MYGHPRTIFPVSKNGILFFNRIELLSQHMNNGTTDTLGLIAGNRSLPLLFARQARAMGVKRLIAVAFEGETDPELLHGGVAVDHEAPEHEHHDQCGCSDHTRGRRQSFDQAVALSPVRSYCSRIALGVKCRVAQGRMRPHEVVDDVGPLGNR